MTDLPRGWASGPLSDFITPRGEKVSPSAFPELPFIGMDHVEAHTTRILGSVPASELKSNAARFFENDVLYGRLRPYLNKVAQPKFDGLASAEFIIFGGNELIYPAFLRHRLNARDFVSFASSLNAGDRPRVNFEQIGDFEIQVPPLNEQRRIVEKIEAMFDEIDAGTQSLQMARTTLDLYRQSLLKSAFEGRLTADWRTQNTDKLEPPETLLAGLERERDAWHEAEFERWQDDLVQWETNGLKGPKPRKPEAYSPSKPLSEAERSVLPLLPDEWVYCRLCDLAHIGSGISVSKARKLDDPVETPYLRVANVQRGHLDLAAIKAMPVERSQLPALSLRTWDILFNEGGDRDKLGRGWIWEDQVETCITQNHVFRATPFRHDKGWSLFISQWGNSYGRDYFEAGGKQTTNLASINKTVLKALPVPICSPAEQAEIVRILDEKLESAAALEADIDAALTRADALRQSILKKAFSGQLVPQDPNDEPASALLERIKAERVKAPKKTRKKAPA